MKRKLLILIVLAICTGTIAYSQYVEDTLTLMKIEAGPLIDGDIDPEWDMVDFMLISEWGEDEDGNPHAPDAEDCVAEYKMLWDDDYFYFLGVVTDDIVSDMASLAEVSAPSWETDSWEFYLAPTNSKLASMEEMTQIRFSYANATAEDAAAGTTQGWSSGDFMNGTNIANAARKLSDDGWILEARFEIAPFSAVRDEAITDGSYIGFNITVSDNDEEATRDWIGSWIGDTQWDQADTLGILKFGEKYVGIEEAPVASKFNFYPNPVADALYISGNANIEAIEIVNAVGATVLRRTNVKDRIDVADLRTGFYFAKVYSDKGLLETYKFIKE